MTHSLSNIAFKMVLAKNQEILQALANTACEIGLNLVSK